MEEEIEEGSVSKENCLEETNKTVGALEAKGKKSSGSSPAPPERSVFNRLGKASEV